MSMICERCGAWLHYNAKLKHFYCTPECEAKQMSEFNLKDSLTVQEKKQ